MPKIYGTLGPRCCDVETLRAMFDAGMTGVRLNLSHITLHDAAQEIENLHHAAGLCGTAADLLIDMQGPELRTGALESPLTLEEGQDVMLGAGGIPVPDLVLPCLTPGQELLLDDGKLLLEVLDCKTRSSRARVLRGGCLKSRKSLALPGCSLHPPTLTQMDLQNLSLAVSYGVTGVMQPFVRDKNDLETVRSTLDRFGGKDIRLFAKIENQEGVRNLDELIPACDEIVIARGDLGNAMPLWEKNAGSQAAISWSLRKCSIPWNTLPSPPGPRSATSSTPSATGPLPSWLPARLLWVITRSKQYGICSRLQVRQYGIWKKSSFIPLVL